MGKGSVDAPNPAESARAQAEANRINQVTPFGNLFFFDPGQSVPQALMGGASTGGNAPPGALVPQPVTGGQPTVPTRRAPGVKLQPEFDQEIALLQSQLAHQHDEGPRRQLEQRLRALQSQRASAPVTAPAEGDPVLDRATSITQLSPEMQQIFDLSQALTTTLGERGVQQAAGLPDPNAPVFSGLPGLEVDDAARTRLEQAQFDRAMSLMNPQFERREEQLRSRLANQGLPQASRAFRSEFGDFRQERSRAEEQAALASVMAGEDAFQRQFGRQLSARQQLGQEQLAERSIPLNELTSLLGLQQVQSPDFFGPSAVDITGPQQAQMEADVAKRAQNQQMAGSVMSLMAMMAMASSRDWKHDHGPAPDALAAVEGLDLRRWQYRADAPVVGDSAEHVGPMAEDWRARTGLGDGQTIHPLDAFGVMFKAMQELSAKISRIEAKLNREGA